MANISKFPFMEAALEEAKIAFKKGEVPIGCVIVDKDGNIIARSHNDCEISNDVTNHAEMMALRQALVTYKNAGQGQNRLEDCSIYVTLEPCPMCAQAISFARVKRLYFGAIDEKGGGVENGARIYEADSCHFKPEVYSGIMAEECGNLLKAFFKELRNNS